MTHEKSTNDDIHFQKIEWEKSYPYNTKLGSKESLIWESRSTPSSTPISTISSSLVLICNCYPAQTSDAQTHQLDKFHIVGDVHISLIYRSWDLWSPHNKYVCTIVFFHTYTKTCQCECNTKLPNCHTHVKCQGFEALGVSFHVGTCPPNSSVNKDKPAQM